MITSTASSHQTGGLKWTLIPQEILEKKKVSHFNIFPQVLWSSDVILSRARVPTTLTDQASKPLQEPKRAMFLILEILVRLQEDNIGNINYVWWIIAALLLSIICSNVLFMVCSSTFKLKMFGKASWHFALISLIISFCLTIDVCCGFKWKIFSHSESIFNVLIISRVPRKCWR